MSGQHCKNYDVKWETVHCYPQNVERCCTSFISKVIICFPPVWPICFAIITNHIMTGPLGNSEFCYPQISMFSPTSSQETLRFSGNKIHCSPRDQSLSVNCFSVDSSSTPWSCMLVNIQLVCLPPVVIFKRISGYICFFQLKWHGCEPARCR